MWFDDVTYVDIDKRTPRFFAEEEAVADLVRTKRAAHNALNSRTPSVSFHHLDCSTPLPIEMGSVNLLISMYAGFISEHCTKYLRKGGLLLCNNSHGDASLASLDPTLHLLAVVNCRDEKYSLITTDLDSYLQPKRGTPPTAEELHGLQRGIAYVRTPSLYVFQVERTEPVATQG
jgi:hypothetical protein